MKETLRIKQIEGSMITLTFNAPFGDLPSKIRNLDENTDLEAEVELDIDFSMTSRQLRINE